MLILDNLSSIYRLYIIMIPIFYTCTVAAYLFMKQDLIIFMIWSTY